MQTTILSHVIFEFIQLFTNALTRNSSLIKYFALVTRGSSPGSGVANRGETEEAYE